MRFIDIDYIQVSADKGSRVGDCFQEALILATTEWRNVNLIHNGKTYKIRPNDLLGSIQEVGGDPE
jgi:hypothetical protein